MVSLSEGFIQLLASPSKTLFPGKLPMSDILPLGAVIPFHFSRTPLYSKNNIKDLNVQR